MHKLLLEQQCFLLLGGVSTTSATGGIGEIISTMKENYLHELQPDSVRGNVNGGDLLFSDFQNTFWFNHWSIKSEFARKIDKFFSMYGYKVNERKLPNITGRRNWNYVKTIGAIVESNNIPEKYLEEYKEMLNSGVTFWHNPQTFLDYSNSNPIV